MKKPVQSIDEPEKKPLRADRPPASAAHRAQRVQVATEMMSTDADLHADQARWHVGKPYLHLVARPFLTQHDCAAIVQADNVERVLTDMPRGACDREVTKHNQALRTKARLLSFGFSLLLQPQNMCA
jgi:hypothetical protein